MSRWSWVLGALLSGCFQTEPIELASDAIDMTGPTETAEVAGPAETAPSEEDTIALGTPCIAFSQLALNFGARSPGEASEMTATVSACGPHAVRVSAVNLVDDGAGRFSLVSGSGVLLRPNQPMDIIVRYTTGGVTVHEDGSSIADRGVLEIVSDAQVPRQRISLEGYPTECPVARIYAAQGPTVPMGIDLLLDGSGSTASLTGIGDYRWTVEAPFGSTSAFAPDASSVTPTFTLDAEGLYRFHLEVTDALGDTSCVAAVYEVTAIRDMSIYVQLTWQTDGDPNQHDISDPFDIFSAGSDMDLHFLSPKANGVYFGSYDCYFANPSPEWGIFDPADNPTMHRDDTDGAGPETIGLNRPEHDVRYQVGAHYYDDWGYGGSVATLRIYIGGELRDEWSAPLAMDDMWDSHYIDWPSGVVTRIGDVPRITPNFYY